MEFDLMKLLVGFIIAFDVLIYIDILKLKRKNNIKIELPNSKTDNTMGYHLYVEYQDKSEDNNGKN